MFVCALAIWAIPLYLRRNPGEDPGEIVIDEVAGQWVALLAVPAEPLLYLAGFALFRFFDIVKPWPVSWADRALPGAIGILLDDILAGVYAFALLQIFLLVR